MAVSCGVIPCQVALAPDLTLYRAQPWIQEPSPAHDSEAARSTRWRSTSLPSAVLRT